MNETKLCKSCKEEINKKAKKCPKCGSKQGVPTWLSIVIIIIAIMIFGSMARKTDNEDNGKCYITMEEFNKIENGMTYDQVKEIVGCEGTINSETEVMGSKMTIYSWYGKDGISNANINISNGKLVNKTQIGLK